MMMIGNFQMTNNTLLFFWLFSSLVLSLILFSVSYTLISRNYDINKISAYECGFEPFEDARAKFDVRFYLVSILFIIFDLEIMFLFPWSVSLNSLGLWGLLIMFFFLFILTVGFLL
jgi:NADH-quinone oxidoreductase subunit A